VTRFSILFCCAILSGCETIPLGRTSSPPPPSHPPTIILFEKTTADRDAIKDTVLRHIPPGTPIEQARSMLEHQGFTIQPSQTPPKWCRKPSGQRIYCQATRQEVEEWRVKSFTVSVILISDDTQRLRDVEIGLGPKDHPNLTFFQKRPDLHPPLGLSIEEARTRMISAGFRCSDVCPGKPGEDSRPYIHCEAFDESLLGGHIVRVRLWLDESGRICESKVLEKGNLFDAERCMWLHGDESTAQAVGKAATYPVRLSCRYALITVGLTVGVACVAARGLY
jgi:hypothetical protein